MGDVVPSSLKSVDQPAAYPDTWDSLTFFLCNWKDQVSVTTSFITDVFTAQSSAEARVGLCERPSRQLSVKICAWGHRQVWLLYNTMLRAGVCRSLVPLYTDVTRIRSLSTGSTINCLTKYRRFFVGGRVAVCKMKGPGYHGRSEVLSYEVRTIASKTDTTITFTSPLSKSYAEGSKVYPLIEAEVKLSSSGNIVTSTYIESNWTATEIIGPSALPVLTPTSNPTYNGTTIFQEYGLQWKQLGFGFERVGASSKSGIAPVFELKGTRPKQTLQHRFEPHGKDKAHQLKALFETVSGSLKPFIAVTPIDFVKVISVSSTQMVVEANGPVTLWNSFQLLGVVVAVNGVKTIRIMQIQNVTRDDTTDVITFANTDAYISSYPILRVGVAYYARFASDSLTERMLTDEHFQISANLIECTEEKTTSVGGGGGGGGGDTIEPPIPPLPPPPSDGPPPKGGCTLPGGGCVDGYTEAECDLFGGTWSEDGCDGGGTTGGCETPDGDCNNGLTEAECDLLGGTFIPEGCPTVGCCYTHRNAADPLEGYPGTGQSELNCCFSENSKVKITIAGTVRDTGYSINRTLVCAWRGCAGGTNPSYSFNTDEYPGESGDGIDYASVSVDNDNWYFWQGDIYIWAVTSVGSPPQLIKIFEAVHDPALESDKGNCGGVSRGIAYGLTGFGGGVTIDGGSVSYEVINNHCSWNGSACVNS